MNNEFTTVIIIAIFAAALVGLPRLLKLRHAFLVPEGYAGVLYHKGRLVEILVAGRHIRWGRFYNWTAHDMRKASLLVAGQEVLSADNVGLKASLLVTYQVADPAKVARE